MPLLKILAATLGLTLLLTGAPALAASGAAAKASPKAVPKAAVLSLRNMDQPIPLSPLLHKGVLPNGLTWYIQKNARPAKQVELRLVVKAGSVLEDEDQQGLAHFLEHMAFNGSTHFKGHELVSFLQSLGMRFGADLNAYTNFDETVYTLTVPTGKAGNLERAMLVLQDWAGGLKLEMADIDKERGVVLEESRRGKGASDRLGKIVTPKILEGSKYAQRMAIGQDEIIKTFPREAIQRFYNDWYRPNLMAVVLVGDIDPVAGQALIKKHFSALKNPSPQRPLPVQALPGRTRQEAVVATDAEATNNAIYISYAREPALPDSTWRNYRQNMVVNLVNQMLELRLQEQTLTENPPFVAGYGGLKNFVRGWKEFSTSALLGKNGADAAIRALVAENERAAQFGFTEAELQRGIKGYLRFMDQYYAERDKSESVMFADEFVRNFLIDEAVPGIEAEVRGARELLPKITLQEVNALVRKWVRGSGGNTLLVYQGVDAPDVPKPEAAALLATLASASSAPLVAYSEKSLAGGLMPQPPTGGRVVSERNIPALGLTEWTLSNGVKVVVKPTDFKNDQILLGGLRPGGLSRIDDQDLPQANHAVSVVGEMGLADFSPNDLRKLMAGKSVQVGPQWGDLAEGFSGSAGSAELEPLLQLLHLHFTQPRRDEALFRSFVGKTADVLRNVAADPERRFTDAVLKSLFGDHPRRPRLATAADFENLNLDQVLSVYRSRFGSAKDFTFFLVGSLDLKAAKPLVARYLGSLPVADLPTQYRDVGLRPVRGQQKSEMQAGTEAKSVVSLLLTGELPYSQEADMGLRALADVLDIRLVEVLREKMGAVYSPSLSAFFGKLPYSRYTVRMTVPCSPENVDKVVAATLAEFENLKAQGPTAVDLAKVKENWIKNYREAVHTNEYWVGLLRGAKEYGEDPAQALTYEARVKALSAADVQKAAQRFLDTGNMRQVVMNPERADKP